MKKKTDTERKAWLDGLKPGDEIMVESASRERWSRDSVNRSKVIRRTPKRIVVRCPWSDKFEWTVGAEDGCLIGGNYRGEIRPISDEDREREERIGLYREINNWHVALTRDTSKFSTATLRAVVAAIGTGSAK